MPLSVEDVHRALSELGEMRFGALQDVNAAMRDIVRTTHSIFDVDGAGLMLADADQRLCSVAVSDERLEHLEELQVEHHEGPGIDAYEDRQLVNAEDLSVERRWPHFSPAAVQRGLHAVLASPIPFNQQPVGVVVVVSASRRPWTPEAELALVAFTDLAALLIASVMQHEGIGELATGLHTSLDARVLIEQATGVLMGQEGVSPRAASSRLRAMARTQSRPLSEVAADVVRDSTRTA